jgi:negative regulator of flagellin synthesis FlgM
MEIRNNAEALRAFLGVPAPGSAQTAPIRGDERGGVPAALAGDQATLSRAGSEVSQAASQADARSEKVAAIQQALATGTYSVSASEVAGKVIDTMLEGGIGHGA